MLQREITVTIYLNTGIPKNRHDNWHVKLYNGAIMELYRFASEEEARAFAAKY